MGASPPAVSGCNKIADERAMPAESEKSSWDRLLDFADREDSAGLKSYLVSLEPNEAVRAIVRQYQGKIRTPLWPT